MKLWSYQILPTYWEKWHTSQTYQLKHQFYLVFHVSQLEHALTSTTSLHHNYRSLVIILYGKSCLPEEVFSYHFNDDMRKWKLLIHQKGRLKEATWESIEFIQGQGNFHPRGSCQACTYSYLCQEGQEQKFLFLVNSSASQLYYYGYSYFVTLPFCVLWLLCCIGVNQD